MNIYLPMTSKTVETEGSFLGQCELECVPSTQLGKHCFSFKMQDGFTESKTIEQKSAEILEWAQSKKANHYSFLAFPHTSGICEKIESLLEVSYGFKGEHITTDAKMYLNPDLLAKGQGDGSSFPSGGLRNTHQARAYLVWDQKSEIFMRPRNKVVYVPSLLVTHSGHALDDKTIFRKSEELLQKSAIKLLELLGIKSKHILMALGVEQEFFAIAKQAFNKRSDLMWTGRTLIGEVAPKNQQFSDHYYGKIPEVIETALAEVEKELVSIGIPFKTKHNEVANNQFQFCHIYEDAGKSIDHNMITMEILKQTFNRHGLQVLLHEKPFSQLNGSGKHCNWSLNYLDENNEFKNLFKPSGNNIELFKLFVLLNISAVMKHAPLYLASIASPGNEIRLGGHEAPPRIISVALGSTISAIIDDLKPFQKKNLKEELFQLKESLYQEDSDRNRTSPYVYTGNKFEFRAVGSSQNPAYPMAVIAATLTSEINVAIKQLEEGRSLSSLIAELVEKTRPIRFEGNGYSQEWKKEATERGLCVNEEFVDNYLNLKKSSQVFVDLGICGQDEIDSKVKVVSQNYIQTVEAESESLLSITRKNILPRCFDLLAKLNVNTTKDRIRKYAENFENSFEDLMREIEELQNSKATAKDLLSFAKVRKGVTKCSAAVNLVLKSLDQCDKLPGLDEFLSW